MSEYRTCAELEQEGFVTECVWSSCIYAMKCQRRCDPTDDESPRPAAPRGTGRGEVTRTTAFILGELSAALVILSLAWWLNR